eukprot:gene21214-34057_t
MSDIYLITKDGVNGAVIDEAVAPTKAAQHKLLTAFSSVIKDTFPKELEKPGEFLKALIPRSAARPYLAVYPCVNAADVLIRWSIDDCCSEPLTLMCNLG